MIGVDVSPPQTDSEMQFESLDLGQESSTRTFYELLRDTHAYAVIHLAFVIDPVRTGVLDIDRMWQINVAGTARVMEAITEVNRTSDDGIKQFIFPSSVSVYGSDFAGRQQKNRPWQRTHCLTRSIRKSRMKSCGNDALPCADAASISCVRTFLPARASKTT